MIESVLLFFSVILLLMAGFPVAFTLGGVALIFAGIGLMTGNFDAGYLNALPSRLYGTLTNETLMAVPLFIFMGITLEKAKIAEDLLETMSALFGDFRGGLAISVILVGMLLISLFKIKKYTFFKSRPRFAVGQELVLGHTCIYNDFLSRSAALV